MCVYIDNLLLISAIFVKLSPIKKYEVRAVKSLGSEDTGVKGR